MKIITLLCESVCWKHANTPLEVVWCLPPSFAVIYERLNSF